MDSDETLKNIHGEEVGAGAFQYQFRAWVAQSSNNTAKYQHQCTVGGPP